jgi:hypothetical protein
VAAALAAVAGAPRSWRSGSACRRRIGRVFRPQREFVVETRERRIELEAVRQR